MFGANRKKFMEGGVESDYADDSSLYYTQQSMFPPHRADKDVSSALLQGAKEKQAAEPGSRRTGAGSSSVT